MYSMSIELYTLSNSPSTSDMSAKIIIWVPISVRLHEKGKYWSCLMKPVLSSSKYWYWCSLHERRYILILWYETLLLLTIISSFGSSLHYLMRYHLWNLKTTLVQILKYWLRKNRGMLISAWVICIEMCWYAWKLQKSCFLIHDIRKYLYKMPYHHQAGLWGGGCYSCYSWSLGRRSWCSLLMCPYS